MILITGAARSGTSMVAGCINKCGAFGGAMSGATKYNRKGMFENAEIRNSIVKPYLKKHGCDIKGQFPLPDTNKLIRFIEWRGQILNVLKKDNDIKNVLMYKGAKICLMWPQWALAFPEAKWVIVRRKKEEIVNSCIRTSFMSAFHNKSFQKAVGATNEEEGWYWWVGQHIERFNEMKETGLNIREIWSDKLIAGDVKELRNVIKWLGLKWNEMEVKNFITPELWHGSKSISSGC